MEVNRSKNKTKGVEDLMSLRPKGQSLDYLKIV